MSEINQCATCPWCVDCDPAKDIPNGYSVELHEALTGTIARPGDISGLFSRDLRAMACHYSKVGEEIPCAGWLANQIGDGNNIAARIEVMQGRMPVPIIVGEQHQRFEDTLP